MNSTIRGVPTSILPFSSTKLSNVNPLVIISLERLIKLATPAFQIDGFLPDLTLICVGTIAVLDFSGVNEPKTKLVVNTLKSLKVSGKVLIVADTKAEENKYLSLAGRNIPTVKMILPTNLNVKDLLEADYVVMTEAAVNAITEGLQ